VPSLGRLSVVGANGAVEIDKVKKLVQLMVDNDLVSISIRNGAEEITLRRPGRNESSAAGMVVPGGAAAQAIPPAVGAGEEAASPNGEEVEDEGQLVMVRSPMVGTFYSSGSPGAAAFVGVGSLITPDTVVCIIEAMKVFNEIPAEVSGTIEKVLVNNEQAVEFGQPLFAVRPG